MDNMLFERTTKRLSILILLLFVSIFNSYSQSIIFDSYSNNDLLQGTSFSSIVEDPIGFMWLGSEKGLNRFDGNSVKFYCKNKNKSLTLSSNTITSMDVDKDGNLWVATNSGLNYYNQKKDLITTFTSKNSYKLDNDFIKKVVVDKKNNIVWAASNSSILRIETINKDYVIREFKYYSSESKPHLMDNIRNIFLDKNARLWFISNDGLFTFDNEPKLFLKFQNLRSFYIKDSEFYLATDTKIIRGTTSLLNHLKENFSDLKYYDISMTSAMVADNNGNLWVGTEGFGLFSISKDGKIDQYRSSSDDKSINNDFINDLYISRNGDLWIASESGINRYNNKSIFRTISSLNINNKNVYLKNVHSILALNNRMILVGTKAEGVFAIDLISNRAVQLHNQLINTARSILRCKNGELLIGTWGSGLFRCRFNEKDMSFTVVKQIRHDENIKTSLINNNIYTLYIDKHENLWIGTETGMSCVRMDKLNKDEVAFKNYNISNEKNIVGFDGAYTFCEDDENNMWVGTINAGLLNFSLSSKDKNTIAIKSDMAKLLFLYNSITIHSIFYRNNSLWMATDIGLLKRNGDGTYQIFDNNSRMSSNYIYGILPGKDNSLWLSSSNGLMQYDMNSHNVSSFDINDGLQSNEFNGGAICRLPNGTLFFGGSRGISYFNANNINTKRKYNNIVITDIVIQNVPINMSEGFTNVNVPFSNRIILPYNKNSFSIYYSSLDFRKNSSSTYLYMLEGINKNWINNGNDDKINFNNLQPGTYTLLIKQNGTNEVTSYTIIIDSPFWATPLAYIIYFIVIIFILALIYKQLKQKFQLKERIRIEEFKNDEIRKINDEKLNFFTNISHEIRTPLSLMIAPLSNLLSKDDLLPHVREQITMIYKQSKKVDFLISQLILFRKKEIYGLELNLEKVNMIPFLKSIYDTFREFAYNKDIKFIFTCEVQHIEMAIDTDKIERVINNLLSNAFKFTSTGGKVEFIVEKENKYLKIRIKDNGPGIAPEYQKKIFDMYFQVPNSSIGTGIGLNLSKNMIELHNGMIDVESKVGEGSCFIITLPIDLKIENEATKKEVSEMISQTELFDKTVHLSVNQWTDNEKKTKILLVDDNDELLLFIKSLLDEKYNVFLAKNGEQGYDIATKEHPNIIISDAEMPNVDGFELCKLIRGNENLCNTSFIMLTAFSQDEYKLKALDYGVDYFVSKPFKADFLNSLIEKILNNKKSSEAKSVNESEQIDNAESYEDKIIDRFKAIIKEKVTDENLSVAIIAEELGMSRTNVYRIIKRKSGMSPTDLILKVRMSLAAKLLSVNKYSVSEIAYKVGIPSPQYFSRIFKKYYGVSPSAYANNYSKISDEKCTKES